MAALFPSSAVPSFPKVFFTLFHSRYSDLSGLVILNYGNGGCDGFSPNFPLNAVSFYGNTAEQKYSTSSVIVSLSLLLVKICLSIFYFFTLILIFRLQPFFAKTYTVQIPAPFAFTFPPAVTVAIFLLLLR